MTAIRLFFLALGAAMGSLIPFGAVLLASKGFDVTASMSCSRMPG